MAVKTYKFILFHLADRLWAMPLLSGSQFISREAMTLVPGAPDKVLGLIYHGGKIITLLDIFKILSIKNNISPSNICLLFDYQGDYYGFPVDEGDNTIKVKQIFKDRKIKKFNKYIKIGKQKVYILDLEDLWQELKIYD